MLQREALEILKTGANVFLTGVPGAGKTYVINQYIKYLEDKGIYPAITASTGIAATHVGGSTIHSYSGIGIEKYLDDYKIEKILEREKLVKKIQNTKVLIIDEISMLDAQTLDNVNKVLKAIKNPEKPFGGVQIIFVGDFFQLPPVVKKGEERKFFAFASNSWKEARPLTCYLEEQFRQSDETFTKLLLAIRENNIDEMHVEILEDLKNKTYKKLGLKPEKKVEEGEWLEEEIQYGEQTPNPGLSPEGKGKSKIFPYNLKLISVARENRKTPTESENIFWELVRDNKTGYEFVRQKPIQNFVVDFYSKELNLVIEIDGEYHLDAKEVARDLERENFLKNLGIRILRFTNEEIKDLDLEILQAEIENLGALTSFPTGERLGLGVMKEESSNKVDLTLDILELHSHNKNVDEINNAKLSSLPGKEFIYKMTAVGRASLVEALIKNCLSPEILKLKSGAKVIFTKNAMDGEYVNGTMGVVKSLDQNAIVVETKQGKSVELKKEDWKIEEDGKVKASISQYPLRLAWAITVHKSQGMSLDEAIINLGETFEYGQGYVALSRLRSLDGLYLKSYNPKSLQVNEAISEFDEKIRKDSRFIQSKFQKADPEKLKKTQEDFITKNGGVLSGGIVKKVKSDQSTQEVTLELIQAEKSLSEIMEMRDLKLESILKHAEELLKKKKLTKLEFSKSLEKDEKFGKINIFSIPNEVKKAFKKNSLKKDEEGNIKLAPVFKELKEKYPYEVLKIYRIFLDQ